MRMRRLRLRRSLNSWFEPLPPYTRSRRARRASLLRWLERFLFVVGIASLGYYLYASAESALYQAYENRELDAILSSRVGGSAAIGGPAGPGSPETHAGQGASAPSATLRTGDVLGR